MPETPANPNDLPKQTRQRRFSAGFWIALLIIALFVLGWRMLLTSGGGHIERIPIIETQMDAIYGALREYESAYDSFPSGDNRAIFNALRGQNPRQIVFLLSSTNSSSRDGELLDPWGTPFKVYLSGNETIVRSAGPNKIFDPTSDKNFDDIIL